MDDLEHLPTALHTQNPSAFSVIIQKFIDNFDIFDMFLLHDE
jgi:hypothetical protein